MGSTADSDRVRRLVYGGSTRSGSLSTGDIDSIVDDAASVWFAAAEAAEAESAAGGGMVKVGDLTIMTGKNYAEVARRFRRKGATSAAPYFGAVTRSDKDTERTDIDRPDPEYWLGMHDNPTVGGATGDY